MRICGLVQEVLFFFFLFNVSFYLNLISFILDTGAGIAVENIPKVYLDSHIIKSNEVTHLFPFPTQNIYFHHIYK